MKNPWLQAWQHSMDIAGQAPEVMVRRTLRLLDPRWPASPRERAEAVRMITEKMQAAMHTSSAMANHQLKLQRDLLALMARHADWTLNPRPDNFLKMMTEATRDSIDAAGVGWSKALTPTQRKVRSNLMRLRRKDMGQR